MWIFCCPTLKGSALKLMYMIGLLIPATAMALNVFSGLRDSLGDRIGVSVVQFIHFQDKYAVFDPWNTHFLAPGIDLVSSHRCGLYVSPSLSKYSFIRVSSSLKSHL